MHLQNEGVCNIWTKSTHFEKKTTSTKCDDMTEIRALFAGSDQNDCDFGKKTMFLSCLG